VTIRSNEGNRPTARNWHKVFATHATKCGLAVTPHWLRHTFGEIVASHIDRRDLRQIYGHSADKTTEGYTDHENDERLQRARLNAANAVSKY
jgi:site-specific recombinase XerC